MVSDEDEEMEGLSDDEEQQEEEVAGQEGREEVEYVPEEIELDPSNPMAAAMLEEMQVCGREQWPIEGH